MSRFVFLFVIAAATTACDPSVWESWQDAARGLQEAAEFCEANPDHDECPQVEGPDPEEPPVDPCEGVACGAGQVCVDGGCVGPNLGGCGFRCTDEDGCGYEGLVRIGWIRAPDQIVEGSLAWVELTAELVHELVFAATEDRAVTHSGILDASADGMWLRPEGEDWWWHTTPEERQDWCAQFLSAWFPAQLRGEAEWYSSEGRLTGPNGQGWDCEFPRDGPLAN